MKSEIALRSDSDSNPAAPVERRRSKGRQNLALGSIFAALILIFGIWWIYFRLERHKHCILGAMILLEYAERNGGRFPQSERGSADAILKLATIDDINNWAHAFVGVDDDGSKLIKALETKEDLIENESTRIYVQGLSSKSNPGIAILFDRFAVKGGDHFRALPGQQLLREAYFIDGSHKMIKNQDWEQFTTDQRALLLAEGFSIQMIEAIYGNLITR